MCSSITEYSENYNNFTGEENCKFLHDFNSKGREIPWNEKKSNNLELAKSFSRLGYQKWYRVYWCATDLTFARSKQDGTLKLFGAKFCRERLCPTCAWRRSLKIFAQAATVMNEAKKRDYEFLFLTLTVRNCKGEDLKETITHLMKSYDRLFKRKVVKKAVKGWFRGLEVTHNLDNKESPFYDTYHPHFHVILAVNKSYFKSRDYIKHAEWQSLWQSCLRVDYKPSVHITKFKSNNDKQLDKSIAEAAKYTVKDVDYIIKDKETNQIDTEATDKAVLTLDQGLKYRRLTAYGLAFKEIHKELNLVDAEEDKDLVHIDGDDETVSMGAYIIEHYRFNIGYSQYVLERVEDCEGQSFE